MFTRSDCYRVDKQTNTHTQTNRRRWKHPTLFAPLRRWVNMRVSCISATETCGNLLLKGIISCSAPPCTESKNTDILLHSSTADEDIVTKSATMIMTIHWWYYETIQIRWTTAHVIVKCTTLCLKKVPTFKLSVTLSNRNRFSKFLHCWKAYGICYKTMWNYQPHLRHVATLPCEIENSNFLQILSDNTRYWRKCKQSAY